jgi:hypothetical protein
VTVEVPKRIIANKKYKWSRQDYIMTHNPHKVVLRPQHAIGFVLVVRTYARTSSAFLAGLLPEWLTLFGEEWLE